MAFPFKEITAKWQRRWEADRVYQFDVTQTANKFYHLNMFIYPSGSRAHVGHWFHFGISDTWARYKRMLGYHVFEPMGYDAFGLPAENNAIATGIHPQDNTQKNIANIREQFKTMGTMYDHRYEVDTSSPEYYKWTQWIFLQLYKMGLAYRQEAPVNWCPKDQTVLANEQVVDGACERCGTAVIRKNLTQWFFRITDYAEELLQKMKTLDWPQKTLTMQRNWIGKSEGAEVDFAVTGHSDKIKIFTTRPDTIFGATYMVLAPEHPLVNKLTTTECKLAVTKYIEFVAHESEIERLSMEKEKTGVFIGSYAINPFTNEQMEIWIADYVLLTYGTGAIMAVPAHDERDCEFARKFDLPIRIVIQPKDGNPLTEKNMPVTYDDITGVMVNSGDYDDMSSDECWKKIIQDIEKRNLGKKKINYRLRDWLISRQRYWGAPIPIIHCETCGLVPVPEKNLPVLLPRDVDFKPTGKSPLARHEGFVNTICPNCEKKAKRDVDTMDTFVDSSWYFLRYLSPKLDQAPFDKGLVSRWLPVDKYIGGAEHSIMHLLYARFVTKVLRDAGWLTFDEPFTSLTHQGTITNKGAKMSKSKGNVVNPDDFVEQYGADAFRMFLMFMGPFEEGGDWSDQGIVGVSRFLNRVYDLVEEHSSWLKPEIQFTQINKLHTYEVDDYDKQLYRKVHQTIKKVTADTEGFHFHTGVAAMMELLNLMNDFDPLLYNKEIYSWALHQFNLLLAPYAPHLAEEIWEMRGNKGYVINQKWPVYDEEATRVDEVTVVVQVNGKIRAKMQVAVDLPEKELEKLALSDTKVNEYLKGKEIKKIIVVPNKLVSLVVS